jgi:hypothetical protein|tara:strand:+ start:17975 stop:18523 length:549 start_codon:yes stop_codon:yes gene_type:complete
MLRNPEELKKVLGGYARFLVNQSRANLEAAGKNSSGNLSNSIRQVVEMKPNGFELIIYGLDYGKFVDQGVSGTSSVDKAPNSPYKFGSGTGREGGLTEGIDKWVKRKGLKGRDRKTGRYITQRALSDMIIRSIWMKGIAPSMFLTNAVKQVMKVLPDDITKAFALDLEGAIYNDLKNQEIKL